MPSIPASPSERLRHVVEHVLATAKVAVPVGTAGGGLSNLPPWTSSNAALPVGITETLQVYMKLFTEMDVALLPKVFHRKGHMAFYLDEANSGTLRVLDFEALEKFIKKAKDKGINDTLAGGFVGHFRVGKGIAVTMLYDYLAGKVDFHTNLVWMETPEGWRILSKSYTTVVGGSTAKPPDAWTLSNEALPKGIDDTLKQNFKVLTDMDAALLTKVFHPKCQFSWYQDEANTSSLIALDYGGLEKFRSQFGGKNPDGILGGNVVGHYCLGNDIVVTQLDAHDDKEKYQTNLVWMQTLEGWRIVSTSFTQLP